MSKINPLDWISQTKAAKLRGVSRQAIWKLVTKGRIKSIEIGGHRFVSLADVESFRRGRPGRLKVRRNRE
jgi:excisionase family DNA binding protein